MLALSSFRRNSGDRRRKAMNATIATVLGAALLVTGLAVQGATQQAEQAMVGSQASLARLHFDELIELPLALDRIAVWLPAGSSELLGVPGWQVLQLEAPVDAPGLAAALGCDDISPLLDRGGPLFLTRDVLVQIEPEIESAGVESVRVASIPYRITYIPPTGLYLGGIAYGINDVDDVVGASGIVEPYLYSGDGGRVIVLPQLAQMTEGAAYTINDQGMIAGESAYRPAIWIASEGSSYAVQGLPIVPGDQAGRVNDLSDAGVAVGLSDNGWRELPAVWQPRDDGYALSVLSPWVDPESGQVDSDAAASAVHESGDVVVGYSVIYGLSRAVMWTRRDGVFGRPQELLGLGGHGWAAGAVDINSAGVVAGWSLDPDAYVEHAVIWIDGQVVDLGTLPGHRAYANAISDAGVVVGEALSVTGGGTAFVAVNGAMYPLDASAVVNLDGWDRLLSATDINNSGSISCYGVIGGFLQSCRLDLVEGP
jgi:probable HAF family extracellular repeat protein